VVELDLVEFFEQGGDGFVVGGTCHAVDSDGEGLGDVIGLKVGGGDQKLSDEGAGLIFFFQVRQ
jgi:hypothetical protein